jgi:hypothetical protein
MHRYAAATALAIALNITMLTPAVSASQASQASAKNDLFPDFLPDWQPAWRRAYLCNYECWGGKPLTPVYLLRGEAIRQRCKPGAQLEACATAILADGYACWRKCVAAKAAARR